VSAGAHKQSRFCRSLVAASREDGRDRYNIRERRAPFRFTDELLVINSQSDRAAQFHISCLNQQQCVSFLFLLYPPLISSIHTTAAWLCAPTRLCIDCSYIPILDVARSRANWSSFIHPKKMKVTPPARPAIKRPQQRATSHHTHTKVLKRRKTSDIKRRSNDYLWQISADFSFKNLNYWLFFHNFDLNLLGKQNSVGLYSAISDVLYPYLIRESRWRSGMDKWYIRALIVSLILV
jgi:hypothetical protein